MTSVLSIPTGVCRYGACVKPGKGKPPLCEEHQRKVKERAQEPLTFEPPTEAQKTAGNARLARRKV